MKLTAEQMQALNEKGKIEIESKSNSGLLSEIVTFLCAKENVGKAHSPSMIAKGINQDKDDIRHCMQRQAKLSASKNAIYFSSLQPIQLVKGDFGTERNGYKALTDKEVKASLEA